MGYTDAHLYFDDLPADGAWTSAARTVTAADIAAYAAFSGDFNPIHVDATYAATTPFGGVIAHGMGVLGIATGLAVSAPPVRTIALLGIREWAFQEAVKPGDTLHLESSILEKTLKAKGRRGEVVWRRRVINQHGRCVQEGTVVTLVECRSTPRTVAFQAAGIE
jgi:3-hydroxybutyryl-CoA dehydratase